MVKKDCVEYFLGRIGKLESQIRNNEHLTALHNNVSLLKSLHESAVSVETDVRWTLSELSLMLSELRVSAGDTEEGTVQLDYDLVQARMKSANSSKCCCECHRQGAADSLTSVEAQKEDAASNGDETTAGCAEDWMPPEGSDVTVADLVKKAAEEAVANTDYVYSEEYKMYYSVSTGYYYDPATQLLYEPTSGKYYRYDASTGNYHLHSQVKPTKKKARAERKERRKQRKKRNGSSASEESKEEGELQGTSEEDSSESSAESVDPSDPPDPAKELPPCIRFVVKASEQLREHRLLLVSFPGATVGRRSGHGLHLPDDGVDKDHAELRFCEDRGGYLVKDLKSKSGTKLNGVMLEPAEESPLGHLDILEVGPVQLEAHIHPGSHTCGHCEPGLLSPVALPQPPAADTETGRGGSSEAQRRAVLKRLKKKYALKGAEYQVRKAVSAGYQDRADTRRKVVGSSFPHERDAEPASANRPLSQDNVGFRMLHKMGWKEGSGLGKGEQGTTEPVPVEQRASRSGLGSSSPGKENPKAQIWKKTRERYKALQGPAEDEENGN